MKRKQSIPKIIHYCWFGGEPIPKTTEEYIKSWRRACPDYEIREWNEHNFDISKYKYTQEAYKERKWAFISDVCRLEKIYEFGGIYLDVNTKVLKRFDKFLEDDMFIGFEQEGHIAPSIFGAKRHHPLIKKMLDIYANESLFLEDGNINYTTINNRLQPILVDMGMKPDNTLQNMQGLTVYPKKYFHPRYWNSALQDDITSDTHTIHYFGASWLADERREWMNFITSEEAPLISIVVPIYGVEKYLAECLDSILTQSYGNIEIVLVDDKTLDRSGEIADEYAARDKRIKVVHKPKNEGLNMARATGFKASTGDFITFIDSDDKVLPDYVEKLVRAQVETNADITMCGYVFYDETLKIPLSPQPIQQYPVDAKVAVYDGDEMIYYYLTQWAFWEHNNNTTTTCCKLFRRQIIDKLDWEDTDYNVGEDDFETLYTFSHSKKNAVINDQLYLYRANPNSISNSKKFTPKYRGDTISAFNVCHDFQVKALKLLGDRHENEVYYRVLSIYKHYIGLLLNKGSLQFDDIVAFDEFFPIDKIKKIKNHSIDDYMIELVEAGGLTLYLTNWLWGDYREAQDLIGGLKQSLTDGERKLIQANGEIAAYLGIKRSARLLAGNIKRRLKASLGR